MKNGEKRDDLGAVLEAVADEANARATSPDWEALGALREEAEELARRGRLDEQKIQELMTRADLAVPEDRDDILETLEREIRELG